MFKRVLLTSINASFDTKFKLHSKQMKWGKKIKNKYEQITYSQIHCVNINLIEFK